MQKIFKVNYRVSENTWSANIALAEDAETVRTYYSTKNPLEILISEGTEYDKEAAERKGMPIVTIEREETEDMEENKTYTTEEAIDAIIAYFKENEDEFNETIEDLDSYCGYLGDDRYYNMEDLDEFYSGQPASEILTRAFYGHDAETWTTDSHGKKIYGEFNPNRDYFYYNGYGNLVSADYKDYSAHLDKWFAEKLINEAGSLYEIPEEVQDIIDNIAD